MNENTELTKVAETLTQTIIPCLESFAVAPSRATAEQVAEWLEECLNLGACREELGEFVAEAGLGECFDDGGWCRSGSWEVYELDPDQGFHCDIREIARHHAISPLCTSPSKR